DVAPQLQFRIGIMGEGDFLGARLRQLRGCGDRAADGDAGDADRDFEGDEEGGPDRADEAAAAALRILRRRAAGNPHRQKNQHLAKAHDRAPHKLPGPGVASPTGIIVLAMPRGCRGGRTGQPADPAINCRDDRRAFVPHPRRRHLGRRHVLRPCHAAPGGGGLGAGAAPGAVAAGFQPLLPGGVGDNHRPFGQRLRYGLPRDGGIRACRASCPYHAGHRHRDDAGFRTSLLRAVAALPPFPRCRRHRSRGRAAHPDPRHRHHQPRARPDRRRGRRDRPLLELKLLELYDLAGAEDDRRFSPFCWRTRLALAHKGLPVTTIPWRFTEKERIAPSGQGRVPVLVDNGRWINDSWAIATYLEETYPDRPSLFGGPAGLALSRFYNTWADVVL